MSKEILFIGQALPEKPAKYPFARSRLYKWLESIEISKEKALEISEFNAILDYFPGKLGKADRTPSWKDIEHNRERLYSLIEQINPLIIVAIGKVATQAILNHQKKIELSSYVGKEFDIPPFGIGKRNYKTVVLPHPSGLSTWVYQKDNQTLLNASLAVIKQHLAFPNQDK